MPRHPSNDIRGIPFFGELLHNSQLLPLNCAYLFSEHFPKGRTVAPMLGRIAKMARRGCSWCNCRHCSPDVPGQRSHEGRVTQKWLDEYEDRPEDEAGTCPKGGLACTCIKLPDECPHLGWDYWDNDFGRYAIGELFPIEPRWTLASLHVVS